MDRLQHLRRDGIGAVHETVSLVTRASLLGATIRDLRISVSHRVNLVAKGMTPAQVSVLGCQGVLGWHLPSRRPGALTSVEDDDIPF